jgi:enoyl-CoA hydratase
MGDAMSEHVHLELEGTVGRIVLDRPRALNALTLDMVTAIRSALGAWKSENLRAVTIESASDRAFCAGGDIRKIRQNSLDERHEASDEFFATEYQVNQLLGTYPIPAVALIDGICMGGGMGLSVHAAFRVVTSNASFAMPETKIGFFPDVGGSHFLPRLPGAVGRYLGLTGVRFSAADALEVGVATHSCTPVDITSLPRRIADSGEPIERILSSLQGDASLPGRAASEIAARRAEIDWVFGAPSLATVTERLETLTASESPVVAAWATSAQTLLGAASPQSLRVTNELFSWGAGRSLEACLDAERQVARLVVATHDFVEGVRSVLVDKDNDPRWAVLATGHEVVDDDTLTSAFMGQEVAICARPAEFARM